MFIKKILSQHRRDFEALFQCEFCNHEFKREGYDDDFFHTEVTPNIPCPACGKKSGIPYKKVKTKYKPWENI